MENRFQQKEQKYLAIEEKRGTRRELKTFINTEKKSRIPINY